MLSDRHVLYNDELSAAQNPFTTQTYRPDRGIPVDPSDSNYFIRNTTIGLSNRSGHTFYETATTTGYFGYYRRDRPTGPSGLNPATWNETDKIWLTNPATDTWPNTWEPRDASTPGALTRFLDGTYPVTDIDSTGLGLSFSGSRPGYLLPDIAPGATQTWNERFTMERPRNNGAYAWNQLFYVSARTCLPVPTIADIAEVSPTALSGTGTNVGDAISVTDENGNMLGTTTVQDDLTWSLTLDAPLDPGVRTVTVTETDEFDFTGEDSTAPPLPAVSVGDFVWDDLNNNGLQDAGEPGLADVSLSITGPNGEVSDVNGDVVGEVTTSADGAYLFDDLPALPAGQHYVVSIDAATVPAGYVATVPGNDSNTATAESADLTTDGDNDLSLDFGFIKTVEPSPTPTETPTPNETPTPTGTPTPTETPTPTDTPSPAAPTDQPGTSGPSDPSLPAGPVDSGTSTPLADTGAPFPGWVLPLGALVTLAGGAVLVFARRSTGRG